MKFEFSGKILLAPTENLSNAIYNLVREQETKFTNKIMCFCFRILNIIFGHLTVHNSIAFSKLGLILF